MARLQRYGRPGARGPRPRILSREYLDPAAKGIGLYRYRLACGHVVEQFGYTSAERMRCDECRRAQRADQEQQSEPDAEPSAEPEIRREREAGADL